MAIPFDAGTKEVLALVPGDGQPIDLG